MNELAFLIIGILVGGCVGISIMSCLQLNRINRYEAEIQRLKSKLNK